MVVKSEIKFIKSLQQKKYRVQNGLFVAEGIKLVSELINSRFKAYRVYVSASLPPDGFGAEAVRVSASELEKMSGLRSPNSVLGVFHIPPAQMPDEQDWMVAADEVQDPGNLGTIIRLCDWFGISTLLCSPGTVDCYNPKVLQATMGSIARVKVVYKDLMPYLQAASLPVYGTFMAGKSVYETNFPEAGILLLGNEAHGISPAMEALIAHRVSIPQFGGQGAESLNVAMAAAILLSELRRPIRK
jgi:TrmH family RNA methyltransferase